MNSGAVCPGCHFGCAIENYQCARGEKFHERWLATGELPKRRHPGPPPAANASTDDKLSDVGRPNNQRPDYQRSSNQRPDSQQPDIPHFTTDDRIMHMLQIIQIALRDLADECGSSKPERRFINCLMRQGGAGSFKIIEERLGFEPSAGEKLAQGLIERGLIEQSRRGNGTLFNVLTAAGLAQASEWDSQRKAAEAEFLSVLSDDEKQQLTAAIDKLLAPGFKRLAQKGAHHPKHAADSGRHAQP